MEAVVLFDYEKQQDDELDLTVGELITNVRQVDDGWCEGTRQGKTGMFPDNFVQIKLLTVPPPTTSTPATTKPGKAPPPDPAPSDPPVVTRTTGQINKVRRAKVAFSYAAENPDELTLQPGQTVNVLGEEEDGWWRGKVGERVGLFPSNFVEIIKEETPPPDPAHPPTIHEASDGPPQQLLEKRPPVGVGVGMGLPKFNPLDVKLKRTPHPTPPPKKEEQPKKPELKKTALPQKSQAKPPAVPPPQEPPVERAKVIFTYTSEQPDELDIKTGDVLEVVNKTGQDGWWKVKLDGREGLVPDNFVELLPSQPPEQSEPLPAKREPRRPPPPPAPAAQDLPPDPPPDFGVPATEPLDSSAVKDRPHRPGGVRPPSRSNLHQEEAEPAPVVPGEGDAPWQKELKLRKKKEPVKLPPSKPHPPPTVSEPEKPAPPRALSRPSLAAKPKPPPAKPPADVVKTKLSPTKPSETTSAPPPVALETTPPPSADEWKEALEKLRAEFNEFKVQIRKELRQEMQTLSDDLDEERKNNASLRIDIDRLKKSKI